MINALLLATCMALGQSAAPDAPPAGQEAAKPPTAPKTAEDRHAEDVKRDSDVGKKYAEQVEKEYKVSKNAEYQAKVQAIGGQFADIANANLVKVLWGDPRLNKFQYHFKVLEGEDVNAFSLPGGYVYVYEGLLKYVESDDELAGVIAHEVSHASFRHLATLQREESKLQPLTLPLILIAIFSGGSAGWDLLQLGQLIGLATGSGWSQKAEEAADYGGYQYMLKSKYNVVGMLTFMERLAADERLKPKIDWGIYRTHPITRERADEMMQWMKESGIRVRRSLVTTTYRTTLKPPQDDKIDTWFAGRKLYTFAGPDAQARAEQAGVKIDAFMDQVPELFDIASDDNGNVIGKGRPLFKVTPADAQAAGVDVKEATRRAVQSLKRSLSILGYRVWDVR
jgi:predicted Zn-dependent protease